MADPLETAEVRIASRRREREGATVTPIGERIGRIASAWENAPRFRCESCGEEYTGEPIEGRCYGCAMERTAADSVVSDRKRMLAAAGVPERYRAPFEDPDPWPADPDSGDALGEWTGKPWAVALFGPDYGCGKSMLAAELLWRCCQARKVRGSWVRAGRLIAALYGSDGPQAKQEAHALVKAPVLVLDELGRAHVAPAAWETLSDFLGERYDWLRPTIITTNLRRAEVREAEGSLFDRLRDGLMVPMMGASRRGRS